MPKSVEHANTQEERIKRKFVISINQDLFGVASLQDFTKCNQRNN